MLATSPGGIEWEVSICTAVQVRPELGACRLGLGLSRDPLELCIHVQALKKPKPTASAVLSGYIISASNQAAKALTRRIYVYMICMYISVI